MGNDDAMGGPARRRRRARCPQAWAAVILLFAVVGCSTSSPSRSEPALSGVDSVPVAYALRDEIQSWLGTPHRLGGMDRHGIDCSGLVVVVYRTLFDLKLPRTTADLIRTGDKVDRRKLMSGDLVFFNPGYKSRHVGIYLGRGEFAHASTSQGVMISTLDDRFWRHCYVTGRRVF